MQECNVYNPPEIEKILDTTLTKNNERYYKVKWVKITWELESDLAYFGNIIEQFWAEYAHKSLLVHPPPTDPNNCNGFDDGVHELFNNVDNDKESHNGTTFNDDVSSSSTTLPQNHLPTTKIKEHRDTQHPNANDIQSDTDPNLESAVNMEELYGVNQCLIRNKKQNTKTNYNIASLISKEDTKAPVKEMLYKCTICDVDFKSMKAQKKHIDSHSKRTCNVCNKQFERLGHLKVHYLIHSNTRPWSCNECDKSFTEKSSLTKHKLIHLGLRQYKCDVCSKSFQRSGHLQRHVEAVHKNIRHFSCNVCHKQFHQKSTFTIHMNVHTGQKPFVCKVCNRAFADKSALFRHTSIHTGRKPHNCHCCERTFSRLSSLQSHLKRKHETDEKEKVVSLKRTCNTKNDLACNSK